MLLEDGTHNLQIYVRSKQKLFGLFPQLSAASQNVKIYEGAISDLSVLISCLSGANTAIVTLGENENLRGISILQDSARNIVAAVEELRRRDSSFKKLRLVYLSSSSKNERFAAARPWLANWFIQTAFYYPYQDLAKAQDILLAAPSLLSVLLVQPPVLVEEPPSGSKLSTEHVNLACSYEDLGAAFVELACHDQYGDLKAIGVSSKGGNASLKYTPVIVSRIVFGFLTGYVPGFWALRQKLGLDSL